MKYMQHSRFRPVFNRLKRKIFSRVILVRAVFLIMGLLLLGGVVLVVGKTYILINSYNQGQLASTSGRVNILILGIGGGDHDSPDLTDSILVFSIAKTTNDTVLLSVPRDIWLSSLKAKINSVYHFGETKQEGGGLVLAKSAVSEIIGQPIHYGVVIDFATFKKLIDTIGGIDITVTKSFQDNQYPIPGKENDECDGDIEVRCRYETIKFEVGKMHMDGQTALKFVRSRHAEGDEGTDFSRGQRQQLVLSAIKAKLMSKDIYLHPKLYLDLYQLSKESMKSDLPSSLYIPAIKLAYQVRSQNILSIALTEPDQLDHPPVSPKYANQWVLIPKNEDPKSITEFVEKYFNRSDTP